LAQTRVMRRLVLVGHLALLFRNVVATRSVGLERHGGLPDQNSGCHPSQPILRHEPLIPATMPRWPELPSYAAPFAAVETTPEGKPVRLKLRRVTSFCNHALSNFAKRSLDPKCEVVSDGLACFGAVAKAGCAHKVVKTGSGAAAARTPTFKWVNTALGNIKAAIVGTYRAIDQKHVPRYLAEFEYRFNRRYDLGAMMPRLAWAAVRTTPMPYRLLKLTDVYARSDPHALANTS
jgi:hypothetical protein